MESFFTIDSNEYGKSFGRAKISCNQCGLYKNVLNPKIEPYGNFKKKIMCIGEAPGEVEDRRGKPWQGKVGTLLQKTLAEFEIDLFEDCLSFNAINCRPPNNRNPEDKELKICKAVYLDKVFEQYQPKLILLFGNAPLQSIIGSRWKKDMPGITSWNGYVIPDRDYKAWIAPLFHPSYVGRSDRHVHRIWFKNLAYALTYRNLPLPVFHDDVKDVIIISDLSILDRIDTDLIAFDYETTGLKPYAEGHKIVCASVAVDEHRVYSFLIPNERKKLAPFLRLLKNPRIRKMAHNIKFEDTWTKIYFGVQVRGWYWDSMLAAHVIDNRPRTTGLKFQTYVNFGVVDYSSSIEKYLKADDNKNGNSKNKVEELLSSGKVDSLLTYCGLDSLYQYRLAEIQRRILEYDHS